MIAVPSLQLRVIVRVKGDAGWRPGVCDLSSGVVVTTEMTLSSRDVVAIRWMPRREGNGERSEPYNRGNEDILGVMRDVAILLALIGGEDPAWVMRMAKESAPPQGRSAGTPALSRGERRRLELLEASELHSTATVDEKQIHHTPGKHTRAARQIGDETKKDG